LRATGHQYKEIAEITGDSRTRVSQLIRRANEHIREALEDLETEAMLPQRAERLRELEDSPPTWLTREIGRPPRDSRRRRHAYATRVLSWRRAALAIDDYRRRTGFDSDVHALGLRPRDESLAEAFDAAVRAIEVVGQLRASCRELGG